MRINYIALFLLLIFSDAGYAESFYFKECKLNEQVTGNYELDLEKKVINVTLKISDGNVQKFTDRIKLVTKDRIISEIIQQKDKKFSTQYFLDVNSKSVIRQLYKRDDVIGIVKPEGKKSQGFCTNVKADWAKKKESKKTIKVDSLLPKCSGTDVKNWTDCQATFNGDGYKYIGEWKNSMQHGKGIEIWEDGRKFTGEFKNDERDGPGVFLLADGSRYSGQYKKGKLDGKGEFVLSNGSKYVGEFKKGKQHGEGKYILPSGMIIKGKFENGTAILGTATYVDGEVYVGEFEFDKPHGKGTLTYLNGTKFVGQFFEGFESGEGTCLKPDGSSNSCRMEKNDIYQGNNIYKIIIVEDWSKVEEQPEIRKKLKYNFTNVALKYCVPSSINGKYKIIDQKVNVVEVDETPAFGLEPVYKLGITGFIQCN
tara:strand:+ start:186 stop:1460 length:1275 start_codon:yes stop_codon:yes gene_type:complete